jgi:assimilatory nitrate reductase catalytic subunit
LARIIDPRRTASCEGADLHFAVASGTDVTLFNGLLVHLAEAGALNRGWIAQHVSGFDEAIASAKAETPSLAETAEAVGVAADDLLLRSVREHRTHRHAVFPGREPIRHGDR